MHENFINILLSNNQKKTSPTGGLLVLFNKKRSFILLCLWVSWRAAIGQFSGPYSIVRPAKSYC